ncbi:hypothetical protein KEX41_28795 (plasmid) [Burkholderia thailandensis]|uniref:hypothetical protein n=1 Tax=Burkholderia thailandensis TaxID=57975 RepID=UPI00192E23F8|nr:hypothetical protein [Burkholderia thailandensis]MBS2132185.1 hypothetical protein [Burkholderia thailandensis]QRA15282.1 hypothetical protein JMY07_29220 [Burkholderia thailandensis]
MMYSWNAMASYGLLHSVFFAITAALVLYLIGRILRRIGLSPLWAILAFVPLLNVLGLWLLAFVEWPTRGT